MLTQWSEFLQILYDKEEERQVLSESVCVLGPMLSTLNLNSGFSTH